MDIVDHRCKRCGGELTRESDSLLKCQYCGSAYDSLVAEKEAERMKAFLDEEKRAYISNIRRNLYDAVTAEYVSSNRVIEWSAELKKFLPDDFAANFYEIAASNNVRQISDYIREIDSEENYEDMDIVIEFLIRSLQSAYLLELNNLIERTYKHRDLSTFEKYATLLSEEAEKVESGVYETMLPRDVFVAYSAKDMNYVSALVETLEEQGIKCFVSARNLRHGKGAVENYDKALKEAMDNCKSFVFVSSTNSRSLSCDALKIELSYVKGRDLENAPPEYRNNYLSIPHIYKKPRVEYRVNESPRYNAADDIVNEFFDGYEWALSAKEVAKRVVKQLVDMNGGNKSEVDEKFVSEPPRIGKYDASHAHRYDIKKIQPTCVSKGYTLHYCQCGDRYQDNFTDLAKHDYTEWKQTERSTCDKNGERKRLCYVCGNEEKQAIPATGHDFGAWHERTKGGKSIGKVRVCRNCGHEEIRSYNALPDEKSGLKSFRLTAFWLTFFFMLYGVLFKYGGSGIIGFLLDHTPIGLANASGSDKLLFAVITFSVCFAIVYVLFILGVFASDRFGARCLILTVVSVVLWYGGYAFCHLLANIDGGFKFWTVAFCIIVNIILFFVLDFTIMDKFLDKYVVDPKFEDDYEKAVYLRWRSERAWMLFGAVISGFGIFFLMVSGNDADGFWDTGVPSIMFAMGFIIAAVCGIKCMVYSCKRGTTRYIRDKITCGNLLFGGASFTVSIASVILGAFAFADNELANDLMGVAFLASALVSVLSFAATVISKIGAKKLS